MSGGNGWTSGALLVVGVNHRTAPLELRERLAFDVARWSHFAPRVPHVLLTTCNRTEVYAWNEGRASGMIGQLSRALAEAGGLSPATLAPHLMVRWRRDAVVHAVRVATGLDSLVVGEEQILGQVRAAVRLARETGVAVGAVEGVLGRALAAGRRVRAATLLGRHPSLAVAAVNIALRTPELAETGLAGRQAIILGAGVMARSAARALLAAGVRVNIANRTLQHARGLAEELGPRARAAPLEALADLLADCNLVVAATAARRPVLDSSTLAGVLRPAAAPLVVLDLGLPRNVEADVRALAGVRLIDLDDLERLCPVDVALRRKELQRAEAMAADEAQAIARWLRVRAASPSISGLRQQGHAIRAAELQRAAPRLSGLTPEQFSTVDQLTEAIVNKLLHGPTVAIREAAADSLGYGTSRRVLDLLRLDRRRA